MLFTTTKLKALLIKSLTSPFVSLRVPNASKYDYSLTQMFRKFLKNSKKKHP